MANNIMNIMSVSFNSQAELEDFLNRVKGSSNTNSTKPAISTFTAASCT